MCEKFKLVEIRGSQLKKYYSILLKVIEIDVSFS